MALDKWWGIHAPVAVPTRQLSGGKERRPLLVLAGVASAASARRVSACRHHALAMLAVSALVSVNIFEELRGGRGSAGPSSPSSAPFGIGPVWPTRGERW